MDVMQCSTVIQIKDGRTIVQHGGRREREREGYAKKGWKNHCAV